MAKGGVSGTILKRENNENVCVSHHTNCRDAGRNRQGAHSQARCIFRCMVQQSNGVTGLVFGPVEPSSVGVATYIELFFGWRCSWQGDPKTLLAALGESFVVCRVDVGSWFNFWFSNAPKESYHPRMQSYLQIFKKYYENPKKAAIMTLFRNFHEVELQGKLQGSMGLP